MSRLNLILLPSMLALALPSWGAGGAKSPGRPLNLSVPRDMVHAPSAPQVDETVERNLRAPAPPPGRARAVAPGRPALRRRLRAPPPGRQRARGLGGLRPEPGVRRRRGTPGALSAHIPAATAGFFGRAAGALECDFEYVPPAP